MHKFEKPSGLQNRSRETIAFFATFICWYLYKHLSLGLIYIFGRSVESFEYRIDMLVALALVLQIAFLQRHTRSGAVLLAVATAVFALSAVTSGSWLVLMAWLFILAARDQELDSVLRAAFYVVLAAMIVILLLFFCGLIGEFKAPRGEGMRHSLGYNHPNVLGMCVQELVALWIYLKRGKMKLIYLPIIAAAAVFIELVPNSRTSVACIALLLILAAYECFREKLPGWMGRTILIGSLAVAVACNLLSVAATLGYAPEGLFLKADHFLSFRLSYASDVYVMYGIPLLGRPLPMMGAQRAIVDNSFMLLLLSFGLAAYLLYSAFHILGSYCVARSGDVTLAGILAVYSLHAVSEKSLIELRFNVFLLAFAMVIYGYMQQRRKAGGNSAEGPKS